MQPDCSLLLLLDRPTLRLLAGNCRLQQFNAELTQSLQQAADVAVSASVMNCHSQLAFKLI